MWSYVTKCFRHYVGFTGRARRAEFWYFELFNALIMFCLVAFVGAAMYIGQQEGAKLIGALTYIYGLGVALPRLAVSVRRMHDIGKGGGWIFISFVPVVGIIWYFILLCTEGETGDNRFGADPKAEE